MTKQPFKFAHGFLGLGNMAQVILEALLENKLVKPKQVWVSRRSAKALKEISQQLKVKTTQDNQQLATSCRYLWLGIKPFQAKEVLKTIRPHLNPNTIVLSMMAGVPVSFLKRNLGAKVRCVRLMPNTPAKLGQGVTGVYFPKNLKLHEKNAIIKILESFGNVVLLKKEADFDAVTGLSGSGPAFVYALTEGMIRGGIQSGLSAQKAKHLTLQTLQGAVAMLKNTQKSPEQLIQQVVSKGGTTEAGLKVLEKHKTPQALSLAVQTAAQRSRQMSKMNE